MKCTSDIHSPVQLSLSRTSLGPWIVSVTMVQSQGMDSFTRLRHINHLHFNLEIRSFVHHNTSLALLGDFELDHAD